MSSLDAVRAEFLRLYEGITSRRGLPGLYGRIMATFFLEARELSQKELSSMTGYSVSSVSRTLHQMVQMGIVQEHMNASREYNVYSMKAGYIDMAISALGAWISQAETARNEMEALRRKIEAIKFKEEEEPRANSLSKKLRELESEVEVFKEIIGEDIKLLKARQHRIQYT